MGSRGLDWSLTVAYDRLAGRALRALVPPGRPVTGVDDDVASQPGIYAFFASAGTWRDLGLGAPPDDRPLYVGKAESTLAARDLRGHFGMGERGKQSPTGSSTVRRSLAALLATPDGYLGIPRNPENPSHFSNYGLSVADDERLSAWMLRRLRISLWPHDDPAVLDRLETVVLRKLLPPLNLSKIRTPWTASVKDARKILADRARLRGS